MAEEPEEGLEELVVRLPATPQIILPEGSAPGAGSARAASAASVELGRRLLLAARNGDTAQLLELMAQGAPFTTDWLGTSPLHLAAQGGHTGLAAILLRAGVSRDARTKVERTPLHLAAHAGHEAVAKLLLDHGAAVDCRDMLRMTPLHWACARGHASLAALLVRRGADVSARCKFRRTPLQAAAEPAVRVAVARAQAERDQAGHASLAALLVRRGADVSARCKFRRTPLQAAAEPAVRVAVARAQAERDQAEEMVVDEVPEVKSFEMEVMEEKPTVKIQQKINNPNLENEAQSLPEPPAMSEASAEGTCVSEGAAALLRQHGIALLPADPGGTVLSALQSGRTVVLSDAGKLMLKENSSAAAPAPPPPPPPAPRAGVVLRACPLRSPPRPGVKVFNVCRRAQDRDTHTQIKYVQLPTDATILSPHKAAMKAKSKVIRTVTGTGTGTGTATGTATGTGTGTGAGNRPGVKIIMNKASFSKLLATATRAHGSGDNEPLSLGNARGEAVVCVPEQFVRSMSARYLRAQLLAAHAALAELQRQLNRARAQRPDTREQ